VKIALDAMGGDLAPKATVEGAVLASRDFGIEVVMVGDGEILSRELADHEAANLPIRIEHAPEVVLMDDKPCFPNRDRRFTSASISSSAATRALLSAPEIRAP